MASTRMASEASSTYGSRESPSVPPSRTLTSGGASYVCRSSSTAATPAPSSPQRRLPRPRTRRPPFSSTPSPGLLGAKPRLHHVLMGHELVTRDDGLGRRV